MSNNLLDFKKRLRPEWYENGPVRVYTREEIAQWELNHDKTVDMKLEMQQDLSVDDIKFLDDLKQWQAEDLMEDIMQGCGESDES